MKISELIARLEEMRDMHGDLEVETVGYDGARRTMQGPKIAYRRKLRGRETKPRFWHEGVDPDDTRGDMVAQVWANYL